MPRIVEPSKAAIHEAAERLRAGDVVAFPTETVYGLGCDVFNPRAIEKVFELKGRPFDNPLIAHVTDSLMARGRLAREWDDRCEALAANFWPGPLTLVVSKRSEVPARATAGRDTVAIRSPDHPVARELLGAFGSPIAAPSANRSGYISPTTAQHVAEEFAGAAELLVLDGGPCTIGIESTVIDMTRVPPRLLRPGSITPRELLEVIGKLDEAPATSQDASPGTSDRHYSPRTLARLLNGHDLRNEIMTLRGQPCVVLAMLPLALALRGREGITIIEMPGDPAAYAHHLYSALRQADRAGMSVILIESPLDTEGWSAVLDRLRRATSRTRS
jgi:L-threonylcarbamoyladenylate synthase